MASGFAFGAQAPAAPAPSGGGFQFSAPAPSAATPAASFGAQFSAAPALSTAANAPTPSSAPSQPSVVVPEFENAFPFLKIKAKLRELLPKAMDGSREGGLASQELTEYLRTTSPPSNTATNTTNVGDLLAKPATLKWTKPDMALRQKLQSDPHVVVHGAPATLTPAIMQEIWKVADDLKISELDAMSLYAHAALPETIRMLEGRLDRSYVDSIMKPSSSINTETSFTLGHDVPKAARELFFVERRQCLQSILLIAQQRLKAIENTAYGYHLLAASNQLVRDDLIKNLVTLIREYSQMADQLEKEIHTSSSSQSVFGGLRTSSSDSKAKPTFAQVHLAFAYEQRQVAAECLFFLAYHTQCTVNEVAELIDAIQDLTNGNPTDEKSGLPMLDPFRDMPRAYHETAMPPTPFGSPFTSAAPPLREKDPLDWKDELVENLWDKGGKPQLLQCVSVLVLTVICALDARHELVDRESGHFNEFGKGNALLPPSDGGPVSTNELLPIHERLNPTKKVEQTWKRKDIWGVMVASYALLLPSVMASPRTGGRSPSPRHGAFDIKSTWWQCLSRPAEFKTFTFARLCLMPAFQQHTGTLDTYEFFMSVLSEFMSHYLEVLFVSGDVPISRAAWERSEEQDLQLRREDQEQKHQFGAWLGTSMTDDETIPSSVNLMNRPDCMDDVVALATALCSAGPSYSRHFWSRLDEQTEDGGIVARLAPSSAVQKLEPIQEKDETLRPIFVAFLAALALADPLEGSEVNGAAAVHEILSKESTSDKQVTWASLMDAIRWYTREMSPGEYYSTPSTTSTDSSTTRNASVQGRPSTAYYYGAEDNGYEGAAGYESSRSQTRSTSGTASSRPKELGPTNNSILLSHLAVVATVAENLPSARSYLVAMKLAVMASDSSAVAGEDPVLTVLLILALAPLTPIVRGAVFTTVSKLISTKGATPVEREVIENMAANAWELVEECRFLPISHLDQFEFYPDSNARDAQGMLFPPSSTSMVGDGSRGAWLPPETKYGMIFEMEHVESRLGTYQSTEGFLSLLSALFCAGGSPALLGKKTRLRTGCAPYIEYVIHCVLPRIMGNGDAVSLLPFRLFSDKSRLVTRALEVVEAVLSSYPVPPLSAPVPPLAKDLKDQRLALEEATSTVRLLDLAESLVMVAKDKDITEYVHDYLNITVPDVARQSYPTSDTTQSARESTNNFRNAGLSIPRPKSPGFTALFDLLNSSRGASFVALAKILTEDAGGDGIHGIHGLSAYKQGVAEALFGETQPSQSVARAAEERSASISQQSLLTNLVPPMELLVRNFGDGVYWREQALSLALRLLCAAAVRENRFGRAVSSGGTPLLFSPVLRFKARSLPAPPLIETEVQVSKLSSLLIASQSQTGVVSSIIQYLRYEGSSLEQDSNISGGALGLVQYIYDCVPSRDSLSAFCGNRSPGQVAQAFATRLHMLSSSAEFSGIKERAALILDLILEAMRKPPHGEVSIAHILLGLPLSPSGLAAFHSTGSRTLHDCLDTVLALLTDEYFSLTAATSMLSSKCYEIIYRLSVLTNSDDAATLAMAQFTNARLNSVNFWTASLLRFLGSLSGSGDFVLANAVGNKDQDGQEYILHSVAWLLKGVSNELTASHRKTHGLFQIGWHESSNSQKLLAVLFSRQYGLALNVISALPTSIERFEQGRLSEVAVSVAQRSRTQMPGAPEVVECYNILDERKICHFWPSSQSTDDLDALLNWAETFNRTAYWDCATSHLASALRTLFESSVFLVDSVLSERSASVANDPLTTGAPTFDLQMLIDMLVQVLFRVADDSSKAQSPATSYSLSCVAALLIERICIAHESSDDGRGGGLEGNMIRICGLFSEAVAATASHNNVSSAVLLASALGTMLKVTNKISSFEDLKSSIAPAVNSLGRLSRSVASESNVQSIVMARLCFTILLDVFIDNQENDDDEISSVFREYLNLGSAAEFMETLISLLPSLEAELCFSLQKVAQCRGGTAILLRARVLHKLIESAHIYANEERRVSDDHRHQSMSIRTPAFFGAHVCLLSTLLTSNDVTEGQRKQISAEALNCLLIYTPVVSRLLQSFPTEGDILLGCVECFLLVAENGGLSLCANDDRLVIWEKGILKLACQISENPLPRRFLAALPFQLKSVDSRGFRSDVVSVSRDNKDEGTWWDVVEKTDLLPSDALRLPDPPSLNHWGSTVAGLAWTSLKYDAADFGLRLLDTCLSVIYLQMKSSSDLRVDWLSFARGLVRLSDLARAAEGRLKSHDATSASLWATPTQGQESIEKECITNLGSMAGLCAERLVGMVWLRLKELDVNGGVSQDELHDILSMSIVLDHGRIDSMGIGCVPLDESDTSRRSMTKDVASDVRKMLTKLQKETTSR